MKPAFRSLIGLGLVLGLSTTIWAKGATTRITISGANLTGAVEIADADMIDAFQVWSGPGTGGCFEGKCVEATEGFIADWSSGEVVDRPGGLWHYEVSFYVTDARFPGRPELEHLGYVVSYEYDPVGAQGYIYLPGKGDQWYSLNSASIYRGREGRWFRATRAWKDAVLPLITQH